MCGLIGYSGKENFDINAIKVLMICNVTRGKEGTGIYSQGTIIKKDVSVLDFLTNHALLEDKIFIGHTRQPSFNADKTTKGCHPFKYEHIVMVHNGTLTNHYELAKEVKKSYYTDFDVDSQVIAYSLSKQPDYKVLKQLDGAAAVIFADETKPGTLYCFRNDERPLYRGKIGNGMYISSIKESLEIINCTGIKEFKTETLYTIVDGEIKDTKKYKITPIKGHVVDNYSFNGYDHGYHGSAGYRTKNNHIDNAYNSKSTYFSPNRWAKCNITTINVTRGEYYYVVENRDFMITVIDDEGEKRSLSKSNFDAPKVICSNDTVVAMRNTKCGTIKKGDICLLIGSARWDKETGEYYCDFITATSPRTKVYEWPEKHFRKADTGETFKKELEEEEEEIKK